MLLDAVATVLLRGLLSDVGSRLLVAVGRSPLPQYTTPHHNPKLLLLLHAGAATAPLPAAVLNAHLCCSMLAAQLRRQAAALQLNGPDKQQKLTQIQKQCVPPTLCPRNVPIQSPFVPDRSMGVASLLALTRK